MDWNDLIAQRHNAFAWQEREVNINLIKESMQQVFNFAPSKNQKYPFIIKLIKNNQSRKKQLMTICHRNLDLDVENDRGNPQVLAPYLIGFCERNVSELEKTKEDYRDNDDIVNYSCLEMGLQAAYLMLALANKGLDTGICSCIQDQIQAGELFGLPNKCKLILGIGYSKGTGSFDYLDPRTNKTKQIPYARTNKDTVYPKPSLDKIYQWEI